MDSRQTKRQVRSAAAERRAEAWRRFKRNRRGYWSLIVFLLCFLLSCGAELLSNDRPLVVAYQGELYFPMLFFYPETTFGGDFETETDYRDPFILEQLRGQGNWLLFPPNRHSYNTINRDIDGPVPSPPTADNWLATTTVVAMSWPD